MSGRSVCVLNGHPDGGRGHLCDALCDAYAGGARGAGRAVEEICVAALDFGFLRTAEEFEADPPTGIAREREKIAAADHLVLVFPLWMGGMPAICSAFLEHCARGGFFLDEGGGEGKMPHGRMRGKSARLVVTMGMPAFFYRHYFRAHGLRAVERNILRMSGFRPVRRTLFGGVGAAAEATRRGWIEEMRGLGARGT